MLATIRRSLATVLSLVALSVLAAGCAGTPALTSSPVPASSFAGWWISADGGIDDVRIIDANGALLIVGRGEASPAPLQLKGATLVATWPEGTLAFTLLPGGHRMAATFTSAEGTLSVHSTLHRGTQAKLNDLLNEENKWQLENAILRWHETGGAYPRPASVRPGTAFAQTLRWPTNPYTHRPIVPGREAGDYRYRIGTRWVNLTFFSPRGTSSSSIPK